MSACDDLLVVCWMICLLCNDGVTGNRILAKDGLISRIVLYQILAPVVTFLIFSQIQVIEDDKRNRGGLFQTGQKGLVPPLVTTSYIAEDQGLYNCST